MPHLPSSSSSPKDDRLDPTMPPPRPSISSATQPLTLIVATTPVTSPSNPSKRLLGIGHNGDLPWPRIKSDMGFFARVTTRPPPPTTRPTPTVTPTSTSSSGEPTVINAVIMGRKTYDSIPERFRPLSKRLNVIITRDQSGGVQKRVVADWKAARCREKEREKERIWKLEGEMKHRGDMSRDKQVEEEEEEQAADREEPEVLVSGSLDAALSALRLRFPSWYPSKRLGSIFVIGGAEIYTSALQLDSQPGSGYTLRLLMTDVRRRRRQLEQQGQTLEQNPAHATPRTASEPDYDLSDEIDGFQCTTFFPLDLDNVDGGREWRKVDPSEATEWVGEEISGEWKWEGDIAIRMRGYERMQSPAQH